MKSLKLKIAAQSLLAISVVILLTGSVLAQGGTNLPATPEPISTLDASGLYNTLDKIIRWIYTFFFAIAIILVLFAAFTYLTSGGSPDKVTSAKNQLIYAAVAVAVALLAYSFSAIIRGFIVQ